MFKKITSCLILVIISSLSLADTKGTQYNLPLKTSEIANFKKFSQRYPLPVAAQNSLLKNGFAVINMPDNSFNESMSYQIADTDNGIPIFITTDSILHTFHVLFDASLLRLERNLLYDDLWNLDKMLLNAALNTYQKSSGQTQEAARRNVAYFAVALELLRPKKYTLKNSTYAGANF
jgi:hypothetical protein